MPSPGRMRTFRQFLRSHAHEAKYANIIDLFDTFSLGGESDGEEPEGFWLVTTPRLPPDPFVLVVEESPELGPEDAIKELESDVEDCATFNLGLIQALREKEAGIFSNPTVGERTAPRFYVNPPTSNEIIALLQASVKRREMHIYNLKRGEVSNDFTLIESVV